MSATTSGASAPAYTRLRPQRQHWWWWALMGVVAIVLLATSAGGPPTEGVSDDRLFSIAERIKCVQCVGESVGGSSAPIAVQFREEISKQMAAGSTDDEILSFFSERYGRDILLTPPSSGVGALVWIVPVVAVAAALLLLASTFRRWRSERVVDVEVSSEDREIVDAALESRRDGPES
jgi:cytochrome c-type biogenesis protein CcmH